MKARAALLRFEHMTELATEVDDLRLGLQVGTLGQCAEGVQQAVARVGIVADQVKVRQALLSAGQQYVGIDLKVV